MKLYENIYRYIIYFVYFTYFLYILAIFGITKYAPTYLTTLRNVIKIYVSLILIIKFNPITFKGDRISKFDKNLIFSSALFLLLSTSLITFLEKKFFTLLKKHI